MYHSNQRLSCAHYFLSNHNLDEVSALVVDIGSSTLRAGYAGDDTPKAVIPTAYGYTTEPIEDGGDIAMSEAGADGDSSEKPAKKTKLYVGQNGPSVWRAGMEVGHPVQNGLSALLRRRAVCRISRCANASHQLRTSPPYLHSSRMP